MYIAYIYTPPLVLITQVHSIQKVDVSLKMNDVGSGSFTIAAENIANTETVIQEMNRVTLVRQEGNGDERVLMNGYIKAIQAQNDITIIELGDMKDFLQTRFLGASKNYTGQTLQYIVSDILSDIQGRYNNGFILDCGVSDIIPDKQYNEGDDILNIFRDLADTGYEFDIVGNTIFFKATLGIDRTVSGDDYLEYNFDIENPDSRSIENPRTLRNTGNLATIVKVKDTTIETRSDSPAISTYGAVEKFFTSSGKDTDTAQTFLDERKQGVREISFTPITRDFFSVSLHDTVKVYINSKNALNNYIGNTRIVEKRYSSGDLESIGITTSTSRVKTLDFFEQIKDIKRRQKTLELL